MPSKRDIQAGEGCPEQRFMVLSDRQDFHKYRLLQANKMAAQALEECCCSNTGKNCQYNKDRDPGAGTAKSFNSL